MELLVSLMITGVLVALLVPAIQAAREMVRKVGCANNIRQIGLALQMHEGAKGRLPKGQQSEIGERPYTTWLAEILPNIELQVVANDIAAAYELSRDPFDVSVHRRFKSTIPMFACPSDSRALETQFARGHWVGLTDYVGVAGLSATDHSGCLFVDSKVSFRDVSDGLSNTLLFGERPPSPDMFFGWWYAGAASQGMGAYDTTLGVRGENPFSPQHLGGDCDLVGYRFRPSHLRDPCGALHFWSLHRDGAYFALADGAVRFFSYSDANLLDQMATRAGGEFLSTKF